MRCNQDEIESIQIKTVDLISSEIMISSLTNKLHLEEKRSKLRHLRYNVKPKFNNLAFYQLLGLEGRRPTPFFLRKGYGWIFQESSNNTMSLSRSARCTQGKVMIAHKSHNQSSNFSPVWTHLRDVPLPMTQLQIRGADKDHKR